MLTGVGPGGQEIENQEAYVMRRGFAKYRVRIPGQ
jgi:hypothetical protein